jgi:hypothetical protein
MENTGMWKASTTCSLMTLLAAVMLIPVGQAQAATKNCYEDIGCPWKQEAKVATLRKLSCENLAHVRNRLYHENGYCFTAKATRDLYGNAGCKFPIQAMVPLSRTERASIANVRKVEREKGC